MLGIIRHLERIAGIIRSQIWNENQRFARTLLLIVVVDTVCSNVRQGDASFKMEKAWSRGSLQSSLPPAYSLARIRFMPRRTVGSLDLSPLDQAIRCQISAMRQKQTFRVLVGDRPLSDRFQDQLPDTRPITGTAQDVAG